GRAPALARTADDVGHRPPGPARLFRPRPAAGPEGLPARDPPRLAAAPLLGAGSRPRQGGCPAAPGTRARALGLPARYRKGFPDPCVLSPRRQQKVEQDAGLERVQVASVDEPARQQVAL